MSSEVTTRATVPAVFVGRDAELDRVDRATLHVRLVVVYGVGGIGKTAFVMKAAQRLVARTGGRIVQHDCRTAESPATLLRAVLDALPEHPSHPSDPLNAVLQRATQSPLVLCLDNAHRASDPAFCEVLALLASRGAPLWIFVASRESLPFEATSLDHVVVRLGGLTGEETRALWHQLEQLYGPAPSAIDPLSSGGNPLLLRHRFTQRKLVLRDQLGLDTLGDDERELLRELAAFRAPASAAYLAPRQAAVDALVRRFLVDERADGRYELHDVVREAVHASSWAPTPQHHARCFAVYAERPADDADELERLHHAVAAGMDDVAEQILLRYAGPLQRFMPPNAVTQHQIAQAIDVLVQRRTVHPEIAVRRILIRGRMGDGSVAYKQLQALRGPGRTNVEIDHAELALALGHVHEAIGVFSNVVADRQQSPPIRAWAYAMLADASRQSGDIARAKELLDAQDSPLAELGPLGAVVAAAMRAMHFHDLELHAEAAQELANLDQLRANIALPDVPVMILRALERAVRLGAGHRISEQDDPGELLDEVPFVRMVSRMLRVDQLAYRGHHQAAAELADSVRQAALAHRTPLVAWWGLWRWGEAMRALGHARRVVDEVLPAIDRARDLDHASAWPRLTALVGDALLDLGEVDEASKLACDAGSGLFGCKTRLGAVRARAKILAGGDPRAARAMFERTTQRGAGHTGASRELALADLDLWCGDLDAAHARASEVESAAIRAGWAWLTCRARLALAEVACRRGDITAAFVALQPAQADAAARGWVAELIHADLLAAVILRLEGDATACANRLAGAAERARSAGLAAYGDRFVRRLGLVDPITCRVTDEDGTRWLTHAQTAVVSGAGTVVDLVRGRVRIAGADIDLARNASQLKLLAALAASPSTCVSIEALVAATWGVEYRADQHRGRMLMTISRLRKLLGASTIELGDGSYRLVLPSPWIILEPVTAPAATSAA